MNEYKILAVLVLMVLALSGCTKTTGTSSDSSQIDSNTGYSDPQKQPLQNGPTGPTGQPGKTMPSSPPPGTAEVQARCGLENCHGMDFVCGPNTPEVCTEQYQLGDFCRQFAICETISDVCQLVPDTKLDRCKTCVSECESLVGEPAFECEFECRDKM